MSSPSHISSTSSSNKKPSKLPIPQPRRKAEAKNITPNAQNIKHEKQGNKIPSSQDLLPPQPEIRKQQQQAPTCSTSDIPPPSSSSSLSRSSHAQNKASSKTESSVKTIPACRIESKDDVNTRTFTKGSSTSHSPASDNLHSRPNDNNNPPSSPSSSERSTTTTTATTSSSTPTNSPRSTKLPRYISSPRKSVGSENQFSVHSTTTNNNDGKSLQKQQQQSKLKQCTTKRWQEQCGENHNYCLTTMKFERHDDTKSELRRKKADESSSLSHLTVDGGDTRSLAPTRVVLEPNKVNKKELNHSSETTPSVPSQTNENDPIILLSPRSDSTTSGILETKSPRLLETTSDSDLDGRRTARTVAASESQLSLRNHPNDVTLENNESKSVHQIWVNLVTEKPSETLNYYSIGITNVRPPSQLDRLEEDGDGSDFKLEPSVRSNASLNYLNNHPSVSENTNNTGDLLDNGSNPIICVTATREASQIIANDGGELRPQLSLSTEDCNANLIQFSSQETVANSSVTVLANAEDEACTGDWQKIKTADDRKPANQEQETFNIYTYVYEDDEEEDTGNSEKSEGQPPSKIYDPCVESVPVIPTPSGSRLIGGRNDYAISGDISKPNGENSAESQAGQRPKSTSSSSSQFSDCSTLSVGSDSSLKSLAKKGGSAAKGQTSADPDSVCTEASATEGKVETNNLTASSLALRSSESLPLKVNSVSLCVAALLSKGDGENARNCVPNAEQVDAPDIQPTEMNIEEIDTKGSTAAVADEKQNSCANRADERKDSADDSREDSARSYETCESSSVDAPKTEEVTSKRSQVGVTATAKNGSSAALKKPKNDSAQPCPLLGSRITLNTDHGSLRGSVSMTQKLGHAASPVPWKPNSRRVPAEASSKAPVVLSKGSSRNAPHRQMDYLVIDRTVSMYNVGSHLEGFLRIRNHSHKTICYRVTSCIPGKYQIIPPEGRLGRDETTAITVASATPASFTQYEMDQFKVETIVVPSNVVSIPEQRLFWKEVPVAEIQTTMVGRMRVLNPTTTMTTGGLYCCNQRGSLSSSGGDGLALMQTRRTRSVTMKPSSASICVYTLIIGLAAAFLHHYSAILDEM